ncbi:class I SAM-dependent methyltransferase [Pararhodonellum marinum]|uniref:class I SAM-dependent methyltransferase n=1 Tax=Pararhodonellum marinum TaxID=2755358 RepID=UPI00188EEF3D|nr:class I SAM-dependent methyltransferase [Pararhodonellum marinum]
MDQRKEPKYIHGYHEVEQERLREQAKVIENKIYDFIHFNEQKHILELGSGVGAQTEILLRRYPHLQITGVEYEPRQIQKAEQNMAKLGYGLEKVRFLQQDATKLDLPGKYDGAFVCWVLEHVQQPVKILHSMKPFLSRGAKIILTEVFNATFYTYPVRQEVVTYWKIYNDYQVSIGGDPQVGARLGDLLDEAGYQNIELRSGGFHLDSRDQHEKKLVFNYWKNLMSSGAPALLEEKLLNEEEVAAMQVAMDELRDLSHSIFYYRFIQATAYV